MQDIGLVMEQLPQTMPAEIADHRATLAFGIALDRIADIAGCRARLDRRNAAHQ